jgi:hypothetical protein
MVLTMPFKIEIHGEKKWWMNFVSSIMFKPWEYSNFMAARDKILLEEYNARIESSRPHNFLVFDDKKQASHFILKWS